MEISCVLKKYFGFSKIWEKYITNAKFDSQCSYVEIMWYLMKEDIFSSPSYLLKYPPGSDLVVTSATGTSGVAFSDTYQGGAANQGVVYSPCVKV